MRPSLRSRALPAIAVALVLAAPARPVSADAVDVPLSFDTGFLRRLLVREVFSDPGGTLEMRTADRCGELELWEPEVAAEPGALVVTSGARARWGLGLGDACWMLFTWQGVVSVRQQPVLDGSAVRFEVVDVALERRDGSWLSGGRFWGWIRPALEPRLERLRVDLAPALEEVRAALAPFLSRSPADEARRLLDSLALASARADADGLHLGLRFDTPDREAGAMPAGPEPPLSPEEVAAFERALLDWDAFLTFVVKEVGGDTLDPALRRALLDVLIDARHGLVAALDAPAVRGDDPVRALFLATWTRLAPLLRQVDTGLPLESALHYLAFAAAGDALAALDAAGPGLRLEISSHGLRRLARSLGPVDDADPLDIGVSLDPELRALFGFDLPLPSPRIPPGAAPAEGVGRGPADDAGPEQEEGPPGEPAPSPPPREPSAPLDAPAPPEAFGPPPPTTGLSPPPMATAGGPGLPARLLRLVSRSLAWLAPAAAHAREPSDGARHADGMAALGARLARWTPGRDDLDEYLPTVGRLLRLTARQVGRDEELPTELRDAFRHLVLATGWQESCWRQTVRVGGELVPLRSPAGAVGLMQVSERVWRGFYERDGLRWDAAYNARAGSEILAHYLRDHALVAARAGRLERGEALVRATYAMYNAGPRALERWAVPAGARSLYALDAHFLEKIRAVRDGAEEAVARCFTG